MVVETQEAGPDTWIYMGPKHEEFHLDPGTCQVIYGHLMATRPGLHRFPSLMIQGIQPGETLAFESLRHPDILVTASSPGSATLDS